jgi:PBSX family phage terminase large subunit
MTNKPAFSPKQWQFIKESTAKFNLAHGSVRSGKTVCSIFRFLQAVEMCKGTDIWITGYSQGTIFRNIISQIINTNNKQLGFLSGYCKWFEGKKELVFMGKTIKCYGVSDQGSVGVLLGGTCDLCLSDEMTLYPQNVLEMLVTRLSNYGSTLFGTMNPSHPGHKCHELIELAEKGDPNYYSLHFVVEDNPFLPPDYTEMLKKTLTGVFYRRYYLGEWCLAEGAIFEFLDKKLHVVRRPPRSADFYIAGIDYGASNPFACVLLGYSSGRFQETGPTLWVEKEYYWNPKATNQQKTNAEFARDLDRFFDGYAIRGIYIDPSAASFKVEMNRLGYRTIDAVNDVYDGIMHLTSLIKEGSLVIHEDCKNLIREMESYCWDPKKTEKGEDEPIKVNDHAIDAMRYACYTFTKGKKLFAIPTADDVYRSQEQQRQNHWMNRSSTY